MDEKIAAETIPTVDFFIIANDRGGKTINGVSGLSNYWTNGDRFVTAAKRCESVSY
jgi:hypothetical protein